MLSHRLQTALDLVHPTAVLVDVGTDHGYLALAAVRQKIAQRVIAIDNKAGPLAQARKNIEGSVGSEHITLLLGEGLTCLSEPYDTVFIAGMGGSLIARILSEVALDTVNQIVLQPSKHPEKVRRWASQNGFTIEQECFLEEAGIYYTALSIVPQEGHLNDAEILYGPCLLKEKSPLYRTYLEEELRYLTKTLQAIPKNRFQLSLISQKHAILEAILREW